MPWSDNARRLAFLARNAAKGFSGVRPKAAGGLKKTGKGVGRARKAIMGAAIKEPKRKIYSTAPRKATGGSFKKGDARFAAIKAKRPAAAPKPVKAAAPVQKNPADAYPKAPAHPNFKQAHPYTKEAVKAYGKEAVKKSMGQERERWKAEGKWKTRAGGASKPAASPSPPKPAAAAPPKPTPAAKPASGGSQHHYFKVKMKDGRTGTARIKASNMAEAGRKLGARGASPAGYIGKSSAKISAKSIGKFHKNLQAAKQTWKKPASAGVPKPKGIPKPTSTAPGPHQPGVPMGKKLPGAGTPISKAPAHKFATGSNGWAKQKIGGAAKKIGGFIKKKFGIRNAALTPQQGAVYRALKPLSRKTNGMAIKAITGRNVLKKKPGKVEKGIDHLLAGNQKGLTVMAWSRAAREAAARARKMKAGHTSFFMSREHHDRLISIHPNYMAKGGYQALKKRWGVGGVIVEGSQELIDELKSKGISRGYAHETKGEDKSSGGKPVKNARFKPDTTINKKVCHEESKSEKGRRKFLKKLMRNAKKNTPHQTEVARTAAKLYRSKKKRGQGVRDAEVRLKRAKVNEYRAGRFEASLLHRNAKQVNAVGPPNIGHDAQGRLQHAKNQKRLRKIHNKTHAYLPADKRPKFKASSY